MESLLYKVMRLLSAAYDADRYGGMRQRYASKEQWEEESERMQSASMNNWFEAKRILCEHKEEIECEYKQELAKFNNEITPGLENVKAAFAVIQKEIDKEAELALIFKEIE